MKKREKEYLLSYWLNISAVVIPKKHFMIRILFSVCMVLKMPNKKIEKIMKIIAVFIQLPLVKIDLKIQN